MEHTERSALIRNFVSVNVVIVTSVLLDSGRPISVVIEKWVI